MPVLWVLAAIAPKDGACAQWGIYAHWGIYALQGAPTVQVQDRTIGEFQNHDTGVNLIL